MFLPPCPLLHPRPLAAHEGLAVRLQCEHALRLLALNISRRPLGSARLSPIRMLHRLLLLLRGT